MIPVIVQKGDGTYHTTEQCAKVGEEAFVTTLERANKVYGKYRKCNRDYCDKHQEYQA
jgi:hypothetical protein